MMESPDLVLPLDSASISRDATPLLGARPRESSPVSSADFGTAFERPKSLSYVVLYFMTIHFLLAFCQIVLVAPLIKLFENSLCVTYYGFPEGGVEDSLCKIREIQRPLATILGWKSTFDTVPVLLVAIPIGRLGDHHGRRKIMALALFGVAASLSEVFAVCAFPKLFPLRLVWLSSAILLCGGGLNSASAFMWAMASESIPSDRRSHGFYYIFSAFYVAELIASFIASVTTDISPWIPCGLAMGSVFLCLLLLAVMPDPRNSRQPTSTSEHSAIDSNSGSEMVSKYSIPVNSIWEALSSRNIRLVIPVFLVGIFRYTTLNVLIQYAYVRFNVKISTGAAFYTETAIVNIFLFLFLIPQLTAHIRNKYDVRSQIIDLFLLRTSVSLMCIGALSIGLAQTSALLPIGVFIFASGFGSRVSALSLISHWISPSSRAALYASITVLESLGHAIGDPSMQQIFAACMSFNGFWMAGPFFVAAGFYAVAVGSTCFIRINDGEPDEADSVEDG